MLRRVHRFGTVAVAGLAAAAAPLAAGVGLVSASGAMAQEIATTPEQQLEDFIHFVTIGAVPVARDLGESLLDGSVSPGEFVVLVEAGELRRFERAIDLAAQIPALNDVARRLSDYYRLGRLDRARDPSEVARNIELLLDSSSRARSLAGERLVEAGEYAMPQLAEAYFARGNALLQVRVANVMNRMGRQAVIPLAVAIQRVDASRQEQTAALLGRLGYRQAVPFLVDLLRVAENPAVREAAERAVRELGSDPSDPAPLLFTELAEAYYDESESLTSFPGEAFQLYWTYDPAAGLFPTAVRAEVYHEAMAMRLAERALELSPTDPAAAGLWVASNYSREIDTPENYDNPVYGPERRPAEYFAVASGPRISQRVLGRSIAAQDTPLARRAIAAIERTAGVDSLVGGGSFDRGPLLQALRYPGRRVRLDAALAIARANPETSFTGADQVVSILASAVRTADRLYAVVLTGGDREEYGRIRGLLESEGFEVLPPSEGGLAELRPAIIEAPGVDLIVTSLSAEGTRRAVDESRADPRLSIAPVVALVNPVEGRGLEARYRADGLVFIRDGALSEPELLATADRAVLAASGDPIEAQESAFYARRALAALRDLALAGGDVLRVSDAAGTLVLALGEQEGDVRLLVADVLSRVSAPRAQAALGEAALDAEGEERVALLGSLAESAKRFGNSLEGRQVRRLLALAGEEDDATAVAAATVVGALELDGQGVTPLILDGSSHDLGAVARGGERADGGADALARGR